MTNIAPGDPVPDLTLADEDGNDVRLGDLNGNTVVLYFYPKDNTPGCTIQAQSLRDNWDQFAARDDLVLYGVSPDSAESHCKFRDRYELPFGLLVDDDHTAADAFGFWVEKQFMGKKYMGVERSTVIINPDGTIRDIWRKVKPKEHTQRLVDELGLQPVT